MSNKHNWDINCPMCRQDNTGSFNMLSEIVSFSLGDGVRIDL